jgi:hypothetical protein
MKAAWAFVSFAEWPPAPGRRVSLKRTRVSRSSMRAQAADHLPHDARVSDGGYETRAHIARFTPARAKTT